MCLRPTLARACSPNPQQPRTVFEHVHYVLNMISTSIWEENLELQTALFMTAAKTSALEISPAGFLPLKSLNSLPHLFKGSVAPVGKKLKLKRFLVGLKHNMQKHRGGLNVIDVFVAVILPEVTTILFPLLKLKLLIELCLSAPATRQKRQKALSRRRRHPALADSLSIHSLYKHKRAQGYPIATECDHPPASKSTSAHMSPEIQLEFLTFILFK